MSQAELDRIELRRLQHHDEIAAERERARKYREARDQIDHEIQEAVQRRFSYTTVRINSRDSAVQAALTLRLLRQGYRARFQLVGNLYVSWAEEPWDPTAWDLDTYRQLDLLTYKERMKGKHT